MTNEAIYSNTIPYFYIIKDTITGKKYAGSKWAKGCNPNNFMQIGGYTTSSKSVNDLIIEFGLDRFVVIHLTTEFWIYSSAYEYESTFLKLHDCAKSDEWINKHNNAKLSYGTKEYREMMMQKYGVEHSTQIPGHLAKRIDSSKLKYGCDHPIQNKEVKNKLIATNMERYNVPYSWMADSVKGKIAETNLERYGSINPSSNPLIREKVIQTNLSKFGVTNIRMSEEIQNRLKLEFEKKYGDGITNSFQLESVKIKSKKTNLLKYGYEYASQSDVIKEKKIANSLLKYGVSHYNKTESSKKRLSNNAKLQRAAEIPVKCPHCPVTSTGPNMVRYHFDNCKHIQTATLPELD